MKPFVIPFIIALVLHLGLAFANFDYFKKKVIEKPKIQFMTMMISHVESAKQVVKPQKKIVKKKKPKPKDSAKKKHVEKKKIIPEKKIQLKKEHEPEAGEEPEEKVEESKGAVAKIQKASPLYSDNPIPKYPRSARQRGWQGVVELNVVVDKHGKVRSVKIFKSSGFSILDNVALKSVKNWHFSPGRKGEEAIEMEVIVPVKFSLTG